MGLFSSDEQKKKTNLKNFLESKIEFASQDFDKTKKSKFSLIFSREKPNKNPLSLNQIIVKGIDYALRSAIVKGAPATTVIYDTAANLIIDRAQEHVKGNINSVSSTNDSADAVLSFKIIQNEKIGKRFKENISRMRYEIQAAIFATSEFIQAQEFVSLNEVLDSNTSPAKKQQILSFVNGHYRLHVSYQSMSSALQLFSLINQELLERIDKNKNRTPDEFHKIAVINAVIVYEVADIIIAFLRAFELQGVKEIREIHSQVTREIERGRIENHEIIEKLELRENSPSVTFLNIAQEKDSAKDRLGALEQLEQEWSALINKIDNVQKDSYKFADCIDDLEILKRNAAANLTILGLMEITKMVKTNIETIQSVLQVDRLKITPITADDVRRFLRV